MVIVAKISSEYSGLKLHDLRLCMTCLFIIKENSAGCLGWVRPIHVWKVLPLGFSFSWFFLPCYYAHWGGDGASCVFQEGPRVKAPVLGPHPTLSLSWRSMLLCM